MSNWQDRLWTENQESESAFAQEKLNTILQILRENPDKIKESVRYNEDMIGRGKDSSDKDKTRSPSLYKGIGGDIKRRKRRATTEDDYLVRDSVIIKVFERSVDFGQFPDNCPIYPMARAWLRNLNQSDLSTWTDIPPPDEETPVNEQLPDCVYSLPTPTDCLNDNDVRIPRITEQDDESLNISADSISSRLTPEVLLESHISHWREIRNRWKEAAKRNESRYLPAYTILKEMYEKTVKDI